MSGLVSDQANSAECQGSGVDEAERCGSSLPGLACPSATGSAGFTLIEILVAFFIFTLVLSSIYAAYSSTFRLVGSTQSQAEIYQMARVAMERICEDIEAAVPPRVGQDDMEEGGYAFVGEDGEEGGMEADSLRFWSRSHISFSGERATAAPAAITYAAQAAEDGGSLALYRIDVPEQEQGNSGSGRGFMLCNRLAAVNFTYSDKEGDLYESWDSSSDSLSGEYPASVAVELDFWADGDHSHLIKFRTAVLLASRGKREGE